MASAGLSVKGIIEKIAENDEGYTKLDVSHHSGLVLSGKQFDAFSEGLKTNSFVTEVSLVNTGMKDAAAVQFAEALKVNTTITKLDLGYNKLGPKGIQALSAGFMENNTLTEIKIHRQDKDMGTAVEDELVKIWDENTTLQRLYCTLHDRRCNQANTRGEVRNKEIAACIAKGKNWDHLNPAMAEEQKALQEAERKKKAEEEAELKKPISAKIESTGGPYTLKQLTSKKAYWPDDVIADSKNREQFLSDEDFETHFKMTKEAFGALAKWKQNQKKKSMNLH